MDTTESRYWAKFLTPNLTQRRLGLVCLGIGRHIGVKNPVMHRRLDSYQLMLIDRGSGWFQLGDGPRQNIHAPTILTLFPGVEHSYSMDDAGWSESWVLFDGPSTSAYEDLGMIERSRPIANVQSGEFLSAFDRLRRSAQREHDPYSDTAAAAGTHELIVIAAQTRDRNRERASQVLTILRRNSLRELTIVDHARQAGVSVQELRQTVQREARCSPKQFVMNVKLSEAKRLLSSSEQSVTRIAAAVGYDDAAYFSRLFTRHVGSPPSSFRAQFWVGNS
jgi:AraC-like DNA-binding protein